MTRILRGLLAPALIRNVYPKRLLRRSKLLVIALCFSLIAGGAAPIQSAVAGSVRTVKRQYELVRTTSGPASFTFVLGVMPTKRGGFIGAIAARVRPAASPKEPVPVAAFSFGRHDAPEGRAQGKKITTCNTAGFCHQVSDTYAGILIIQMNDKGGPRALNRFFIVTEGRGQPDIELQEASGWKLVTTELEYRYVDGSDAAVAGVYAGSEGVEVFTKTTLAGGKGGSLAQAEPPCSGSRVSVLFRGAGYLELRGGEEDVSTYCPQVGSAAIAASAPKSTEWILEGAAAGDVELATTRLFVVDLPPKP